MEILIPVSKDFNFKRTAISHGWYDLQPFEFDKASWTLKRVINLTNEKVVTVSISEAKQAIKVNLPDKLSKRAVEKIDRDVRHIFRLDDEMVHFYNLTTNHPEFDWIARAGAGRMLRSPTVFEDLVKSVCTTNCTWALTSIMVKSLVGKLGVESKDGRKSFPTPGAMAAQTESFFRDEVRAGYRSAYLKEMAERVASGEIDPESWLKSDKPTKELKREIKQVKGVGDYAAENLLKLIGRYEGLALDSWLRSQFAKKRNKGRAADDKKIVKYYSKFGEWGGLVIWCDMTRDWMEDDNLFKS
jgi:N-glycosylase/DNA lyase